MWPHTSIVDRFFTPMFTGRGVGLVVVLGIMRGQSGALTVYSEPGRGSTFKVLFPRAEGSLAMDTTTDTVSVWSGHGTVLVIDDEPSVRRTVSRMLEHLGFETFVAEDGAAGVALYREHAARVSLVMLDLTMPMMDGEQTFAELRRTQADVRVILMSGFNQAEAVARFTGQGLAGFLQKPFSFDTLRGALQSVFT